MFHAGERFSLGHGGGWVNVRNMFSPRSNFASTVLDGSIYVIGGFNGEKKLVGGNIITDKYGKA